jgi:hypothetical protein
MAVCTSSDSYQVWLAVSDGPQEREKEAAKQYRTHIRRGCEADHSTTGAVRIAGSPNLNRRMRRRFRWWNSPVSTLAGQ